MSALTSIFTTALRLSMLLAVIAIPALAMPLGGQGDARFIESSLRPNSGAGLVIVVGLQRAQ